MKPWKSSKVAPAMKAIAICGILSFAFQNCAKAKFSIDPGAKSEALGKENVFDHGDDGNIAGTVPGDDGNTSGMPIGFGFECSNAHSQQAGGNLLTVQAAKIVIVDKSNKVACELTGDFKTQILNTKKITITPCADLAAGKYEAHVMDASVPSNQFLMKELTQDDIKFTVNADGSYTPQTKKVNILYDYNSQNNLYNSVNTAGTSTSATQKNCDSRVSPLIISMDSQSRGINLTSPLAGIQFDILGENSFPKAHDKKQISWLTPDDQEYYFIVLPNKNGQVLGIDEMFGDNTRGPDGKFAANGYAALSKYDDDKDGMISEDDAIYSELRLWNDKNRDGIADPNELSTLQEKGVTVIDLHYDKRYQETDQYGNQTLMKSVIKTEDGKLHLLFDLWFRYLDITK